MPREQSEASRRSQASVPHTSPPPLPLSLAMLFAELELLQLTKPGWGQGPLFHSVFFLSPDP